MCSFNFGNASERHVNRPAVPLITAQSYSMASAISAHKNKKLDIWQAVMSILRRDWAKYQQLLITHPWKTQTTGTGIVINEGQFLN